MRKQSLVLIFSLFLFRILFAQDSIYFKTKVFLSYQMLDSAYYYVNELLKNDDKNFLYWQLKGNIQFAKKNWNGAINSYLKAEDIKQNEVLYPLAQSYAMIEDFEKASVYLEKYLNQRDRIPTYVIQLDTCFKIYAKTEQWNALWEKDWDSNYQDLLKQIEYNIRYGHLKDALEQIENYLVNHSKKYYLYYLKGKILLLLKDKQAGFESFQKAYDLKPKNQDIAQAYGKILFGSKKFKKAKKVFQRMATHDKTELMPLREIGKCDYAMKKNKLAIQELKDYLKYYFNDPDGNYYLALTYYRQKSYFNALKAINISINVHPNCYDYILTRGKIYFDSQAYKLALKDFLLALDLQAGVGELYFLIGRCYSFLGDPGMACTYWKRAYEFQYMEADDYRMKYCQ